LDTNAPSPEQDPLFRFYDLRVYMKGTKRRLNKAATAKKMEAFRHRSAMRWVAKHGSLPDPNQPKPLDEPTNRQQRRHFERTHGDTYGNILAKANPVETELLPEPVGNPSGPMDSE
jgi:hypothetical protein